MGADHYSNPDVDTMLEEARATGDEAKRQELYDAVQKKVVDGPSIIISVPEPGALALLALGCLALGLRARRS